MHSFRNAMSSHVWLRSEKSAAHISTTVVISSCGGFPGRRRGVQKCAFRRPHSRRVGWGVTQRCRAVPAPDAVNSWIRSVTGTPRHSVADARGCGTASRDLWPDPESFAPGARSPCGAPRLFALRFRSWRWSDHRSTGCLSRIRQARGPILHESFRRDTKSHSPTPHRMNQCRSLLRIDQETNVT